MRINRRSGLNLRQIGCVSENFNETKDDKTTSAIKQKKQLPEQLNVATSCCDTLRTLGGRLACQGGIVNEGNGVSKMKF
jgi:hypothetical protein